jgi:hypothetical protein
MARNSGPTQGTFLVSAARTTTQTQADQFNHGSRGLRVVLDMTESASSPSVTVTIDVKDLASGKYVTLLSGAAVTGNTTNVYTVYPGVTETGNVDASAVLGSVWRIKVTANNANTGTYSVGYELLP